MSEEISREEIAALLASGSEEMTREETKVKTFDVLRFIADNSGLSMFEAIEKAYNMGASEQEPKWIPVSERLPEKNMACLVAVGEFNLTQIARYSDLMGIKNRRIFYQGDYGNDNFEDITQHVNAWMPLPEPYKVESEDK